MKIWLAAIAANSLRYGKMLGSKSQKNRLHLRSAETDGVALFLFIFFPFFNDLLALHISAVVRFNFAIIHASFRDGTLLV